MRPGGIHELGGSAGWKRTTILSADSPSISVSLAGMPRDLSMISVDILRDGFPIYMPFLLTLDSSPGFGRAGMAEIPYQALTTLISTYANFAGFGVCDTDAQIGIPVTSPQPGTGALPTSGVDVNRSRIQFPPVPGFPTGTTSTLALQRSGGVEGELGIWDPAVGIDTTIYLDPWLSADGSAVTVIFRSRDAEGVAVYPFDWQPFTDLRLVLVAIQESTGLAAISDNPTALSQDQGSINVRYQFRDILLDRGVPSDYTINSAFGVFDVNMAPHLAGLRWIFPENDQNMTPPAPWNIDNCAPRAIAYTHTARPRLVTYLDRRDAGVLLAGSSMTVRGF